MGAGGIDYGEYGRRGREEFRAGVIAAFPKFVLASGALLALAGANDFFKFARAMRDGGRREAMARPRRRR